MVQMAKLTLSPVLLPVHRLDHPRQKGCKLSETPVFLSVPKAPNPTPLSNTLMRFLEKFSTTYRPHHHFKLLKIRRLRGFHGGNTGSNPVGDAKISKGLQEIGTWLRLQKTPLSEESFTPPWQPSFSYEAVEAGQPFEPLQAGRHEHGEVRSNHPAGGLARESRS
jgi:hypothetical protein